MTSYSKGANFERRVAKFLTNRGWLVIRSAGSKSPVDLVALRQGEVWLVQCKVDGYMLPAERLQLLGIAAENRVTAKIAYRDGKELIIKSISETKVGGELK